MRILLWSDLHLSNHKTFSSIQDGYNSRMLIGINILKQIRSYYENNNISIIIFCGDLFENGSNLSPDLLEELLKELKKWKNIPNYFLIGQHDYHSLNGNISGISPLFDYINLLKNKTIYNYGELSISACWHANTKEKQLNYLSEVVPGDRKHKIFMGHFLIKEILEKNNAPFPTDNFVSLDDLPSGFDYYFLGDYHPHVWLPEHKVMSVGLTHQNSFKDANCKGSFIDFDLDKGTFERIFTIAPEFIKIDAKDISKVSQDHFYEIVVKNKDDEKLLVDIPSGIKFSVSHEYSDIDSNSNDRIENLHFSMDKTEIVMKYLEFMNKIDDKEIVELGLQYMSQYKGDENEKII